MENSLDKAIIDKTGKIDVTYADVGSAIRRICDKLGPDIIKNIWGKGYYFNYNPFLIYFIKNS